MYTFVDFTSQITERRGVPCPTNKGVSYTNLVCTIMLRHLEYNDIEKIVIMIKEES